MPWLVELCTDTICGGTLGLVKGVFGISLFTEAETEEIRAAKELVLSVVQKSPEIISDPIICEGIRNGQKSALETFKNGLSAEAIAAGVGATAELVCTKSFNERFTSVLMGACMNIVGC